jgi:hypothetical protein
MSTRKQRRERRLAQALARFYERQAALSAAAGCPRLGERRALDCLEAGRALAELVTHLHETWRPPVRLRR